MLQNPVSGKKKVRILESEVFEHLEADKSEVLFILLFSFLSNYVMNVISIIGYNMVQHIQNCSVGLLKFEISFMKYV